LFGSEDTGRRERRAEQEGGTGDSEQKRERSDDPDSVATSCRRGAGRSERNRSDRGLARAGISLEALEVGAEFGRALGADVAVLLQGFINCARKARRQVGIQSKRWSGSFVEDGVEDGGGSVPVKGESASSHFVKDHAKGEEVGAGVHVFAESLLGRHVGDGAHGRAGAGEMAGHRGLRIGGACGVSGVELGETEVENFGVAAARHENIGRLDVAVNDVLGMSGIERIGDIDGNGKKRLQLKRMGGDGVLERVAVEIFHGNEGAAIVLADFVNGADVGMIQRGRGSRFEAEAFERLRIVGDVFGEELKGYEAAEFRILGLINYAHAAAAQLLDCAVVGDGLANHAAPKFRR